MDKKQLQEYIRRLQKIADEKDISKKQTNENLIEATNIEPSEKSTSVEPWAGMETISSDVVDADIASLVSIETITQPQKTEVVEVEDSRALKVTDHESKPLAMTTEEATTTLSITDDTTSDLNNYFSMIFKGNTLGYGAGITLKGGESFTVQVDYLGLLSYYNRTVKSVGQCKLWFWGRSRMVHSQYSVYSAINQELVGNFSATHNFYSVDLTQLYMKYGNASFIFVAGWSGEELIAWDSIDLIDNVVTGIEIAHEPEQLSYTVGGTFNKTGLVVKATYLSGLIEEVTDYSVTPSTNLSRNNKFVTISYNEFSVVQPIRVNSQTLIPTVKMQSRSRKTYNSKWSEWEDVPPPTDLKYYVSYGEFSETRAVLTIDRSKISLAEGDKTGLRMQLNCAKFPKPSEPAKHIKINGMRVKKAPMYNFINGYIGDLKAEDSENLEVVLEYDDYSFQFNYNDSIRLFFCNECDPTTLVETKQIEVAEGSLNLNLCTGEARYEFVDFDSSNNTLGCGISHVSSSENELNFYGQNYSLNLCENLILDSVNANKIIKSHIYTDACGVRHTFSVVLYYIDNGKRVYIPREEYDSVASDLRYLGHPIFVEQVTVNNQIYLESPSNAVINNAYYKNLLTSEGNELILPVRWLKCGEVTKGFNAQGNLVLIIDEFNNYIAIDYNANGSINKVCNNTGNYVNFTYNAAGYLQSLINNRNKKVKYSYALSRLTTIEYCELEEDNATERVYKTVNLSYVSLKKDFYNCVGISQIDTSDKYRTIISYDSSLFSSKVSTIHNYSVSTGSDENGVLTELSNLNIEFDYLNNQTTLTDDFGDKEIYEYENGKSLTSYYSIKNGKVAAAKKLDYNSYSIYTETKAKPSILNKYSLDRFVFEAGEKIETHLNAFNMPTWTELTGAYLTNNAYKYVNTYYEYDDNLNCIETQIEESFYDCSAQETTNFNFIIINNIYNAVTGKLVKRIMHSAHDGGGVREKADIVEYVYDSHGNRTKEIRYSVDWENHSTLEDCNCSAMTATDKFYLESSYNSEHNVISVKDETGLNATEYDYYSGSKSLSSFTNGYGTMYFGYDSRDRLSNIYATVAGESNGNTISYNLDKINKLEESGGTKFTFDYDAKRRLSRVKLDESILESYRYQEKLKVGNDVIDRITKLDANNTSIKVEADRAGKFIKKYCNNELQLTENYNSNETLDSIIDYTSNRNIDITYDNYGNITKFEEGTGSNLLSESFEYNARGLIDEINYTGIVDRTESFTYSNNSDAALTEISYGNLKIKPTFDINGRLTTTSTVVGLSEISNETITYIKEEDHATFIPLRKTYKNAVNQTLTSTPQNPFITNPIIPTNENTTYTYDEVGNIETILQDGTLIARYYYDNLNRLIREDNAQFNQSYEYEYDNNGNIQYKKTYNLNSYTELISTKTYSYDKDKLISFDTEAFTYDSIGNPTLYCNKSATWSKGKQLTSFDGNSFEYDGQGRRIKKNDISFYYDSNNRLIKQSNGLQFYYNGNDVVAVGYKNKYYYYRKDMQGNVIAILDSTGKKVVVYSYDAWGNQSIAMLPGSTTDVNELVSLNPFTYRSYYYDTETGLYYLNARYYDPEIGRFINMDSIDNANPEAINGLNLYAYCGNNPVMNIDPTGKLFLEIFLAIAAISLFTPVGGVVAQTAVSAVSYVGMAIGAIFDEEIRTDMNAIGWNPFNTDENAVLGSSKVSFYKGMPVYRTDNDRSGTFYAILLSKEDSAVGDLRHERGHGWQSLMMGIGTYGLMIGLPSMCEWSKRYYYDRPWEITADILGGVNNRTHSQQDISRGWWYFAISNVLGPFGYFFLLHEYK